MFNHFLNNLSGKKQWVNDIRDLVPQYLISVHGFLQFCAVYSCDKGAWCTSRTMLWPMLTEATTLIALRIQQRSKRHENGDDHYSENGIHKRTGYRLALK